MNRRLTSGWRWAGVGGTLLLVGFAAACSGGSGDSAGSGSGGGGGGGSGGSSPMTLEPPTGFIATGQPGSPFSESQQSYTWSNTGTTPVEYTRTISVSWLDVTGPAAGSVGDGQQIQFTVSLTSGANSLAVGRHVGTVVFRDPQGAELAEIGVTVVMNDPDNDVVIAAAHSTFTTAAVS